MHRHSFYFLIVFSVFLIVVGVPKNVTVDDSFPDPLTGNSIQYFPAIGGSVAAGNWQDGQDCNRACTADVDLSKVFNGTYRYAEANIDHGAQQRASLLFSGSAVYVMCIWLSVAPAVHVDSLGNSDITFRLNDTVVGTFSKKVTTSANGTYNYDTPVFVKEDLPPGLHNLTILSGLAGKESVIMLDRIIYTMELEENIGPTLSLSDMAMTLMGPTIVSLQQTVTVTTSGTGSRSTSTKASATSPAENASTFHPPLSLPPAVIGGIITGGVATTILLFSFVIWLRKKGAHLRGKTMIIPFENPPPSSADATSIGDTHLPEYASLMDVLVIGTDSGCGTSGGTELETRDKSYM